jgi:hypothetical protein
VAVLAAVGTVVVVALIATAWPPVSSPPAAGLDGGVPVPPAGAYSTSAFCPSSTGTAAAGTIYLTNSTPRSVTGVMTAIGPATASGSVPTVRRSVSVPGHGTAAIDPADGLPAGDNAASFVFDGGGVVADRVVSGPGGWSTAPCASRLSSQWSFAGGSTTAGDAVSIALLNPTSTEAVVNISFVTGQGTVTPQAYQGLVVPAGHLVVENVGDFVQDASAIGTFVVAQAGTLVASEFQLWSSGASGGLSLQLGAPALSTAWYFAQTTVEAKSTVGFTLANPGSGAVTATVSIGLPSGSVVPRTVVVPPQSTTVFPASGSGGLPEQVPCSVTIGATAPIVVGRSVEAPAGAPSPLWGASAGTAAAATGWLVPGPGVPGAPGTAGATATSLALADHGSSAAVASVTALGSDRPVATVQVAADRVVVLGPKVVGGLSVFVVSATRPITVEEDSGPTGAPGIVSSAGFPFAA